jgi:hypothetical protein
LIYLLIGVGAGALIYGYLPQEFVLKFAGPDNPLAIPVAAIIGIPLYIRAENRHSNWSCLNSKGDEYRRSDRVNHWRRGNGDTGDEHAVEHF